MLIETYVSVLIVGHNVKKSWSAEIAKGNNLIKALISIFSAAI